jgi:hypothetical protein
LAQLRVWPIPSLRFCSAWIWRWQAGERRPDRQRSINITCLQSLGFGCSLIAT